jgi:hypothetical protein
MALQLLFDGAAIDGRPDERRIHQFLVRRLRSWKFCKRPWRTRSPSERIPWPLKLPHIRKLLEEPLSKIDHGLSYGPFRKSARFSARSGLVSKARPNPVSRSSRGLGLT